MKAASLLVLALIWSVASAVGQGAKGDGEQRITERGPHHRVWERQTVRLLPNGLGITNRSSIVELETGMHFSKEGQWSESKEEIEIFQDGAIARQGQNHVSFSPNLNSIGVIDLQTVDGQRLRSHVLGLGVYDPATGTSELIAEVKDSIGELNPPNEMYYRDAFDGVAADMRYIYRKRGFEQDVIVRETIELPPGYNPATTLLEVWTEFVEAPVPRKIAWEREQVRDETLDFGALRIGLGKAFVLGEEQANARSIPISKRWMTLDGRTFLIEAVEFQAIRAQLQELPARKQRAALPARKTVQPARADANRRPFPAARQAAVARPNQKIMMASLPVSNRGLVLDYEAVSSTGDFRFQCDKTYYVSGAFTISGAATFEGGAVIKYANTNSAKIALTGTILCESSAYRPVILTARDDHSVGEQIGSAARSGYYASTALDVASAIGTNLNNFRISYATKGLNASYYNAELRHIQFVGCQTAYKSDHSDTWIRNALLFDCGTGFDLSTSTLWVENTTAHKVPTIGSTASGSGIQLTNCLLISVTNGLNAFTFTGGNNYTNLDDTGIFQTVGAATHYLASGSTLRNAGTTNISSSLVADLKKRTTYPPIVIGDGGYYTNSLTLYPQAQRDTDTPDLGYHYDPLDYVFSAIYLTNASITATPGVAIGIRTMWNTGLGLLGGSALYCEGTPDNLNHIVRYNMVQEQSNTNWTEWATGTAYTIATAWSSNVIAPVLRLRFTEFSVPASSPQSLFHIYGFSEDSGSHSIRDCQFHGGDVWSERPTFNITNCLFNRSRTIIAKANHDMYPTFRNCTFVGGELQLYNDTTGTWTFKDNLFDGTTTYMEGTITNSYNAYTTNVTRLTPTNINDIVLSVTNVAYATGGLGSFYLPTNLTSHSTLFNSGSWNATNVGLYHFTTTTNQVKETNSVVDIGFHYVAVNSSGSPLDSDGDGRADYLEDTDGDGIADAGETGWQVYNSLFGAGGGPGLVLFTPLR